MSKSTSQTLAWLALAACLSGGCGSSDLHLPGTTAVLCAQGAALHPKLFLHPHDHPVHGRYIVILLDSVLDIETSARELAAKYGGEITSFYSAAVRGFGIALSDAQAPYLAREWNVCFVEQVTLVSIQ